MIATQRDIHIVRLAVHEIEDIADALKKRARSPTSNSRAYNVAMQTARWMEKRIEGRQRIAPLDVPMMGKDWNKLAEFCANSGLARIARKIWTQIDLGD